MNVDGLIFASEALVKQISSDLTIEQVANVATLPGLVGNSLAMPDAIRENLDPFVVAAPD